MQRSIRNLTTRVFQWVDREGNGPAARAKRANRRIGMLAGLLCFWIALTYAKGVWLVHRVDDVVRYAQSNVVAKARVETRRGDILDRNGVTLATSLRADSVSVNPHQLLPLIRASHKAPVLRASKWPSLLGQARAACDAAALSGPANSDTSQAVASQGAVVAAVAAQGSAKVMAPGAKQRKSVQPLWEAISAEGVTDGNATLLALEKAQGFALTGSAAPSDLAAAARSVKPLAPVAAPLSPRDNCAAWLEVLALSTRRSATLADLLGLPTQDGLRWPFAAPAVREFRTKVANRLAELTGNDAADLQRRIHSDTSFVYLAKNLRHEQAEAVRRDLAEGGLPKGIVLEQEFLRFYPKNTVAGPLIGRPTQTGSIEASYDALLKGQLVSLLFSKDSKGNPMYPDGAPEPTAYGGKTLKLTIDEKIQAVAEFHLDASVQEFKAKFGIAAVMDVNTGEVLALATSPSLNPNETKDPPQYGWHNPALEFQYEPGSTGKVWNMAIGLQEGKLSLTETFVTGAGYALPGKVIKDDHPHGALTGKQCLQVSSNICNCKIAQRINRENYYNYLVKLGFGRRIDLGIIGESNGQLARPEKWSMVQYCNIAFGQGIATTPLQMAAAFAAVANGGIYRRPSLVREELAADGQVVRPFVVDAGRRVFDEKVSAQMRESMASVTQPRDPNDPHSLSGTATRARLPNYTIGGKTGTAQQAENGRYSDTHWVGSFIGFTPVEKPRLVIFVAIDTPTAYDEKAGRIMRYGGAVAAPVAREVARFALPYLGVAPSPGAPYLDRDDPVRARQMELAQNARAKLAAGAMAASAGGPAPLPLPAATALGGVPTAIAADPNLGPEQVRVPDIHGLPMRVARLRMAASKLHLSPAGSGMAVAQDPPAGTIVAKDSEVRAQFVRLSEVVEERQAPVDEDAVEDAVAVKASAAPKPTPFAKPVAARGAVR